MTIDTNAVATSLITALIASIAGGVFGFLIGRFRSRAKRLKEREDALCTGVRSLLRSKIVETHEQYVVKESPCSLLVKELTEKNYTAYHDLGGNGTCTVMYDEIMALPIRMARHTTDAVKPLRRES